MTTVAIGSVGFHHRQAGFLVQVFVEFSQQRHAAGQHDAALVDVAAQLRRHALERLADGLDDGAHGFGQRLSNLCIIDRDGTRHALGEVAAFDFHLQRFMAAAPPSLSPA